MPKITRFAVMPFRRQRFRRPRHRGGAEILQRLRKAAAGSGDEPVEIMTVLRFDKLDCKALADHSEASPIDWGAVLLANDNVTLNGLTLS